jgi:hypothetical protein
MTSESCLRNVLFEIYIMSDASSPSSSVGAKLFGDVEPQYRFYLQCFQE